MKSALKKVLVFAEISSVMGLYAFSWKYVDNILKKYTSNLQKAEQYNAVLNQWLMLRNKGCRIADFLSECGYRNIAIYGCGNLGKSLYEEIKSSDKIDIKYYIDRNAGDIMSDLKVYRPGGSIPEVDAIVVTPVYEYNEIFESLSCVTKNKIISIGDILFQM